MNRRQQEGIEYLKEKHRVLREKLGPNRLLLSDELRGTPAEGPGGESTLTGTPHS